jgi:hypothetical protein
VEFDLAVGCVDDSDESGVEAERDFEVHAEGFELGTGGARVRVFGAQHGKGTAGRGAEGRVFGLAPVDEKREQSDATVGTKSAPTARSEPPFEEMAIRAGTAHRLDRAGVDAELADGDDGSIDLGSFDCPGPQ